MNQVDEDCMVNRFGKYSITFINKSGLELDQIMEKFAVFDDDEPQVSLTNPGRRIFVNYSSRENAITARKMYPELEAVFSKDKKIPNYSGIKEDYNAKRDSANKTCIVASTTGTRQSLQKSKSSDESTDIATGASGCNNAEEKNISASGNTNPETQQSEPPTINPNVSSNDDEEDDFDDIPSLACTYDVEPVANLSTVETTAAVLSSIPTWFVEGEIYRLVHESTSLWPLFIDTVYEEDEIALLSAYVHFRSRQEAEECVKKMNYLWVENRQLICLLLEEIPLD